MLLTMALAGVLTLAPQDTSRIDIHAAAMAVLDSGAVWAEEIVPKATRVVIDRDSFEAAAQRAGVTTVPLIGGVESIRTGAVDVSFESVRSCVGRVQPRCTLPAGTIVLQAMHAERDGERTTVTVALRWPYRGAMGFVEYDVTFRGGAVVSVQQVRRS